MCQIKQEKTKQSPTGVSRDTYHVFFEQDHG